MQQTVIILCFVLGIAADAEREKRERQGGMTDIEPVGCLIAS